MLAPRLSPRRMIAFACFSGLFLPSATAQVENVPASDRYTTAADSLSHFIAAEIEQKKIPAVSIAVVDAEGVMWAHGFGFEDPQRTRPATAATVYRVGSVSKLLADIAVVQAIEQGKLKLDDDIRSILPDFQPHNPFDQPITLRRLMNHQSGLVREPPVGSYFDAAAPSLAATVASLNDTTLVHAPGSATKYSNAAVAVAGRALEVAVGRSFAQHLQSKWLAPLGMDSSSFASTPAIEARLAAGQMWSYDGRRFPAPNLQMGCLPAGNLYSTVLDLGRFMQLIFRQGELNGKRFLSPKMLAEMLAVSPAGNEKPQREFGIGFAIGKFDGRQTFEHGGAIYGHATQFIGLPSEQMGVIVVASLDVANGWVQRVSHEALRAFLRARDGQPVQPVESTGGVDRTWARSQVGLYSDGVNTRRLIELAGALRIQGGTFDHEIRRRGEAFFIDDVQAYGPPIEFGEGQFTLGDKTWKRIDDPRPPEIPTEWSGLVGEYGWDHNTLFVYEDGGRLWTLIEWVFHYPLQAESDGGFAFPNYGLYPGERLVFERDAQGTATSVVAAGVTFPRRRADLDNQSTFRIRPLLPVDRLQQIARAAEPPVEPGERLPADLVELVQLEPGLHLDIRYATENNFMGTKFYDQARAFLQRPAATALATAHRNLKPRGYGLLIHDAYRPWYVTKMFWEATPAEMRHFVANPEHGSRHNRGCAVDLTLFELDNGQPVTMVSGYDEFSERAYPEYPGGTARERWHRRLLRSAMEAEQFEVYEFEWWHFDFHLWPNYPIANQRFQEISQ